MTQLPQGVQTNDVPPAKPGNPSQLMRLSAPSGDAMALAAGPLQHQTTELVRIFSDQATGETFKRSLGTALYVFKLMGALLLRLAVVGVAVVVWVWGLGFQLGYYFRKWIDNTSPTAEEIVCNVLWAIARPFVLLYQWANSFLGWEDPLKQLKQQLNSAPPTESEVPAEAPAIDVQPAGDR
ncbi:hypothetical protein C8255_15635 [filamentous cyanobacterium CCP3]|nr:hypothetical protein C8255_15635 [filamentous cyanobacterium CCP3]